MLQTTTKCIYAQTFVHITIKQAPNVNLRSTRTICEHECMNSPSLIIEPGYTPLELTFKKSNKI